MSSSTWTWLEKALAPIIGRSSWSTCAVSFASICDCRSSRSLPAPSRLLVSRLPCWSTTRTASTERPGTEPETRLTMAATWLSASWRPGAMRTMIEADGATSSRTKTERSALAIWTRTASTPSISLIVSISSRSCAARRRSPSSVRLAPSGRLSSISEPVSGAAIDPSAATIMRARYTSLSLTLSAPVLLLIW